MSVQRARYNACRDHARNLFIFYLHILVCPCLYEPFFSVIFFVSCLPEFLTTIYHHVACFFCLSAQMVSVVGTGRSPLQYRGYQSNPADFNSRFFPRARVRLVARHGRGLSSKFYGQASGELIFLIIAYFLWVTGGRGGVGGCHCHGTIIGPWVQKVARERGG